MMTVVEVERMREALKVLGLSDTQILVVLQRIAPGTALPMEDQAEEKSSN